ncbi:MAG: hypothetical protein SW833_01915 [Cyanobacteriota bacterium]|nr:hypothetical protein [Cyanobacteriota bacterium]
MKEKIQRPARSTFEFAIDVWCFAVGHQWLRGLWGEPGWLRSLSVGSRGGKGTRSLPSRLYINVRGLGSDRNDIPIAQEGAVSNLYV